MFAKIPIGVWTLSVVISKPLHAHMHMTRQQEGNETQLDGS